MVDMTRVRKRLQELLLYFSKEYIKAYKTALVLHIRAKKNGEAAEIERPEFLLLKSSDFMPQPAIRIEGDIYVGEGFKEKQHWVMGRNWVVLSTPASKDKEEKTDDSASSGAVAPASPGAGTGRRDSTVPDAADARIWLDNDATEVCMNQSCGAGFSLFSTKRHCRMCGEIFCKKCRDFRIKDLGKEHKFCEPCYNIRTAKDADPSQQLPLLEKPTVRTRIINFNKYKVSLSDADLFAAAGASNASSTANKKDDQGGKFVLVLTHRRSTRPQLKIGFDTEEQRDQWRALIQTASWAGPSPITMDPILRQTFMVSFRKLRWHAWVWTSWDLDGTEGELLSDILSEVLYREILAGEFTKMPAFARNMAVKTVYRLIVGGVSSAWTSLQQQLPKVRGPIEELAEKMLGPLFEEEAKVKAKITQPMEEAAAKGLDSAEGKLQEVFADKVPVIAAAAEAQLNTLHRIIGELIKEVETKHPGGTAEQFDSLWWWAKWRADWTWSFGQAPISRMIEAKLVDDAPVPASRKLGNDLIRDLKDLYYSAFLEIETELKIATVGATTAAEKITALREMYPGIIVRAAKDIPVLFQWRMSQALDMVIMPPLMEVCGAVISTLCDPLVALIPELIQDIVDPARMCNEILADVATRAEQELVKRILAPLAETTLKQGDTLAAQAL